MKLIHLFTLACLSAMAGAAELVQTATVNASASGSGTGTLVAVPKEGVSQGPFEPFNDRLGTLKSFTISWNSTHSVSGVVVSLPTTTSGSFSFAINGDFSVNGFDYGGGGNGGGNGGPAGGTLGLTSASVVNSTVFTLAEAGSLNSPRNFQAILSVVTGDTSFHLDWVGKSLSPGVVKVDYTNLASLTSSFTSTATLTYDYTPRPTYRTVETFAGSGTAGAVDATGTAATYNGPWGISSDALGNLYHADYTGKRIRRTTPAGVVSFIDSFSSFVPIATAIDPATGYLYVAIESHRILRYVNKNAANYPTQAPVYGPETDFPDATIVYAGASTSGTTNAGGTSARFNAPHGLHVRGGFLYVADKGNNLVRKIDLSALSNAAVTTVTATGGTLSAPEAVWVAEDGTIYVACTGSDLIQKIAPGGVLSTVAGSVAGNADGAGTAAKFNDPRGLAMNGRGELFVADSGNHAIRRISPDGTVLTIAGGSATGAYLDGAGADVRFNSPRGIAFGRDGLLYVTDHSNHRIRRMEVTQPLITGAPASMAAFTADSGSPSATQTFDFAGNGLEGPITVTAPSGFEVSTDGSSYARSITSNEGATLSIRLAATAATGSLAGNLTLASAQADIINIALSGQVAAVLEPSVGALTGFSSTVGGASAAQSFSLTGRGLNDVVKVTVPAGYEISTDGLNFASAVSSVATLGQPAGYIQSILLDAAGQNTVATGAIYSTGSGNQFPNDRAFAALKTDGSVVTWGDSGTGGNSSSVAASLSSGVTAVYSNSSAFAALKNDGSVVTWGRVLYGGDFSVTSLDPITGDIIYTPASGNITSNVTAVYSNSLAFAALKTDGSVVTWGDSRRGGDFSVTYQDKEGLTNYTPASGNITSNVTAVYSNINAFAALKTDGSVVTWGDSFYGGDSSSVAASLSSGVTAVYSTGYAFAALKNDGSVVTWGSPSYGGDSSSVVNNLSSGVIKVYSNEDSFAALKNDGSVVAWGNSVIGGNFSSLTASLSSEVTSVYSNQYAFAALKNDGSVVTWGPVQYGGNSSSVVSNLSSGVIKVYSTRRAFAALKSNGSVITWGESGTGGNSSSVAASLSSGVTAVYSDSFAFAALKNDGSVITWGDGPSGGNSSSVVNNLSSGVIKVYSNDQSFAALKNDGSVVTWGNSGTGGSGGPANIGVAVPPTLPLTLHVRLAATAPLGAVAGNLTIATTDATTQTVALSGTVTVTVNQVTPTVSTWPTATAITYGQTLASSTLSGGAASVAGSFAFTTPGTTPDAGTAAQAVTFTPTDAVNYSAVSGTASVVVNRAAPSVSTWPTATAITYGQTLVSSTLSGGAASVPGTFDFTAPGTAPDAGTAAQAVTFTPTDAVNYSAVSGTASVLVNRATATVVLGGLTAVDDGTAKAASATTVPAGLPVGLTYDLSATAPSLPGTYAVVATVSDPNYVGSASGSLVISPKGPVFSGYSASTKQNQTLVIARAKILSRASDPYGGKVALPRVFGPSAQGGAVSLAGNNVTYTPATAFVGVDTFEVELTNPAGGITRGLVTITVTGTAQAAQNLGQLTLRDGVVDLVFQGIPGRTYVIQRSANLTTWTALSSVTAAADGKINYTDPNPLPSSGFYRTQE